MSDEISRDKLKEKAPVGRKNPAGEQSAGAAKETLPLGRKNPEGEAGGRLAPPEHDTYWLCWKCEALNYTKKGQSFICWNCGAGVYVN
jgi:hypothetical protein